MDVCLSGLQLAEDRQVAVVRERMVRAVFLWHLLSCRRSMLTGPMAQVGCPPPSSAHDGVPLSV